MWLWFAPAVFGVDIRSGTADVAHIGGAFVIVVAVIAMAEVIRTLRLFGVAAGLVIAVLILVSGADDGYAAATVATGRYGAFPRPRSRRAMSSVPIR